MPSGGGVMRRKALIAFIALVLAVTGVLFLAAHSQSFVKQQARTANDRLFANHPPITFRSAQPGAKTPPPQPVDADGRPALLARPALRNHYIERMAEQLDVATTPPASRIGVFAKVLTAGTRSLRVSVDPASSKSPNAIRSVMTP